MKVLPFLLVLGACANAAPKPSPAPALALASDAGLDAAARDAGPPQEPVASLDELASRAGDDAPLMREVLRVDQRGKPVDLEAPRDTCFRASFGASRAVSARFEDKNGVVRGDGASGLHGLVPPRGPVCVRKGESIRFAVEGDAETMHAIVWASP